MSDKIQELPETRKSGDKVVREAISKRKKYKSYSMDQGMMVPGYDTRGRFVGYSLKRPKDQTKKYAGGGIASGMRRFNRGGKV